MDPWYGMCELVRLLIHVSAYTRTTDSVIWKWVRVMFYRAVAWDPWLIVAQIVCLQCLYYITLGLFLSILVGARVPRMSLMYFFDYSTLTASTVTGWCITASFLLSALVGAGYMLHLIKRAKKCLDFSATLYLFHLFICIVYGGWPSSITWWIVNGTGFAVMALLGEWLCIRQELQEIPITRFRSLGSGTEPFYPEEDATEDIQTYQSDELLDYCTDGVV